jgi:hypothetical protein
MKNDPIVEETHTVRDRLAADFGYDVSRIFADMRSRECLLGDRLKNRQKSPNSPRHPCGGSAVSELDTSIPAAEC